MASNLAAVDMWNKILESFSIVQRMTDDGLLKKVKPFDKAYEKTLEDVEKQFGRLKTGLDRLDTAEDLEELKAIANRWIEIWEIDLADAQGRWARAYINKVHKAVRLAESREED